MAHQTIADALRSNDERVFLDALMSAGLFDPRRDPEIISKTELFRGVGRGTTAGHGDQKDGLLVSCFSIGARKFAHAHERRLYAALRGGEFSDADLRAATSLLLRIRSLLIGGSPLLGEAA